MRSALLVALLAIVVYANSIGGRFVSDDRSLVLDHPFTKRVADWPRIFTAGHYAGTGGYRPITTLSFAINYSLGGEDPVGYHLVNIVLHALNSALVFLLLRRLFASHAIALIAASIFAIHPIHTEAVAWISGRAELLAAAFFLCAWLLHLRAAESLTNRWRVLSWIAFILAALSKENALVFPFALVLGDLIRQRRVGFHSLAVYASYLAVLAIPTVLRWTLYQRALLRAVSQISLIDNPLAHVGVLPRVITALEIQAHYLRLLIWPAKLCADYSFDTIPIVTQFWSFRALVSLAIVLVAVLLAVISFVRRSRLWFGVAFYVLAILPVANIIMPIGTIAGERLLYLPSIGFCAVVALAWKVRIPRPIAIGAVALIVIAGGTRTWLRNRVWRDDDALWSSVVAVAPRNFKAQLLVGTSHLQNGQINDAIAAFRQALSVDPKSEDAALNLAVSLLQAGRNSEAIALCRQAIARHPDRAAFHVDLGLAYAGSGDFARAVPELARAVQLDPENAVFRFNLGLALSHSGDLEGAMARYREATQLNPEYAEAWNALGAALLSAHRNEEARSALQRALALKPNYRDALYNLRLLDQTP